MESFARLSSRVSIALWVRHHVAILMIESSFYDTVTDGLGGDILGGLFGRDVQARADVAERDPGVREGEHADASFDDVLAEAEDEGVGAVFAELAFVVGDAAEEGLEVADSDGLHELEVGVESGFESGLAEDGSFGDVTHQELNNNLKFHRL